MASTITTPSLAQRLGDPQLDIVDVRPMAAYNGWRLRGESRGGHIPGAFACPLKWMTTLELSELGQFLASKGLRRDRSIVICGYTGGEVITAATILSELRYETVSVLDMFLAEWAADSSLPLTRLFNYEKLIHPEWLHRLIDGSSVETLRDNGFAVFHVNSGSPEQYASAHIPTAAYLDTNVLESAPLWNRRSKDELLDALRTHGITHDRTVVLYGRDSPSALLESGSAGEAGQITATRAAVILMYAGVKDVRVLDGGLDAWLEAGFEVETEECHPTPIRDFGARVPARPEYLIDTSQVKALMADPSGILVSVRSWAEYIGETSGYDYVVPRGRIAGAVWGRAGSDAHHMQHYRNVDNTMRSYTEIEAVWQAAGIIPDKNIAFYCGTGWRASEAFFCAYLMGWERIAVYDGGWFEWSQDESNPVELGPPKDYEGPTSEGI
jgi:thiosulfate/3-mercaptopyruvate sulfurtransferase